MKTIFTLLLFTCSLVLNAHTHISGTIKGNNGETIVDANAVLTNTYDGTSTALEPDWGKGRAKSLLEQSN
jgi:hypothetical protein